MDDNNSVLSFFSHSSFNFGRSNTLERFPNYKENMLHHFKNSLSVKLINKTVSMGEDLNGYLKVSVAAMIPKGTFYVRLITV